MVLTIPACADREIPSVKAVIVLYISIRKLAIEVVSSFDEDLERQERKAGKRTDLDTGGAAMKVLTRDILKMKPKSSAVLFVFWERLLNRR